MSLFGTSDKATQVLYRFSQAKTIVQAEIDTACELGDFFRHNVQFAMVREFYLAAFEKGGK